MRKMMKKTGMFKKLFNSFTGGGMPGADSDPMGAMGGMTPGMESFMNDDPSFSKKDAEKRKRLKKLKKKQKNKNRRKK
jgi:hypothetical protein